MNDVLEQRLVTPSILSADFGRLAADIATVIDAGARLIHVDVMDGHFVPNITIGAPVVKAIAPAAHERGAALDVHLMIEHPERYVDAFAAAGADAITVHQEACVHLHRTLAQIREAGAAAGVALNPATPVETLSEVRDLVDLVLIMSVNPGFGGQRLHQRRPRQAAPRPRLPAGRGGHRGRRGRVARQRRRARALRRQLAGRRQQRLRGARPKRRLPRAAGGRHRRLRAGPPASRVAIGEPRRSLGRAVPRAAPYPKPRRSLGRGVPSRVAAEPPAGLDGGASRRVRRCAILTGSKTSSGRGEIPHRR